MALNESSFRSFPVSPEKMGTETARVAQSFNLARAYLPSFTHCDETRRLEPERVDIPRRRRNDDDKDDVDTRG